MTLLQYIGASALFTLACWPAVTSPANMARHVADQCRHKQLYVAMTACERARRSVR